MTRREDARVVSCGCWWPGEDPDGDGTEDPVNPDEFAAELGFESRLLFYPDKGSISDFYNFEMVRNGVPEEVREEYVSNKLTDEAIDYIEGHDSNDPFFLWVAYNVPYEPLRGTRGTIEGLDPEKVWIVRVYVLGDNGHGAVLEITIDFRQGGRFSVPLRGPGASSPWSGGHHAHP